MPTQPPGYTLPTTVGDTCAGVGVDSLTLHGKVADGAADVWANGDIPIRWPAGYEARFEPSLVIVDGDGEVRGREGEEMVSVDPWHGQLVCPYHSIVGGDLGPLAVAIFLPHPPLPTPEGSRQCSEVVADLRSSVPVLRADLAAMVGGATDSVTRNQLANDASRTLDALNRHQDCYLEATLVVWRANLDYLANPWRAAFIHTEADRRLDLLGQAPLP